MEPGRTDILSCIFWKRRGGPAASAGGPTEKWRGRFAVLGGHIKVGVAKPSLVLGQIEAGLLKPLAVDGHDGANSFRMFRPGRNGLRH